MSHRERSQPSAFSPQGRAFRTLLENLPAAAYTCDCDGLITYYNERAAQLWGRAPKLNDPVDRFCGSFRLFAADGTAIAHDQCWMALALQTGHEYNGQEIVIERSDGCRVTALAHANPIFDDAGQLTGAVNVLVDISDRKRAEEAQSLLAAIVESSEDAIISKSLDGRILSWNAGAEQLFGYTAEEAIGQPITLIIPPERHEEEQAILAILRRGERLKHYETVRVSKQGRTIDISLSISPLFDSAGTIVGASKVARDITLRKAGEEALVALKDELAVQLADLRRVHEMSLRLSTTLELRPILEETLQTATGIEDTDLGILLLCDPQHNELHIGASLGFDERCLEAVERMLPGGACGTCFHERARIVVDDVETDALFIPYREQAREAGFRAVHSTPLLTRSGRIVGVLSTYFRRPHSPTERQTRLIDVCARHAVDFIEHARLYNELREADRRKDEFLATLAHELRNPLAPISNSLNLLRLFDDLDPAAQRIREIMQRQVDQMVRLVDDLLEVSRITSGKIALRKQRVEMAAIVRSAVETSRPWVEAAGHQLAITLSPEPMTLQADPVRLAQVISNLLNNAAKFTDRGGQIWLTARREEEIVVVSVRDNGVGIRPEMLPRVFEMFAQGDATLKRTQSGLGIGLTLAKRLVEMHGGQIEAHSAGPGKGSEFIVRVPAASTQMAAAAGEVEMPLHGRAPLASRRILVVDDAQDATYILGKMLETMGQQVRVTNDAATARELARIERPEVVISDIAMPDMNGYELARCLRRESENEDLVLVALTGYGRDSDRRRARDAGFDYHLVKPVSIESLYDLLSSLGVQGEAGAARH